MITVLMSKTMESLLDAYRKDPRAIMNGGYLSLFNWGKEHYNTLGKARGRQIDGGADFGAIIKSTQHYLHVGKMPHCRSNPDRL